MLQDLSGLKNLVTSSRRSTETFVFYLHYRITFLLLMFACALITTRQFVGDKIDCLSNPSNEISISVLETYCWSASTYSVTSSYLKQAGVEVPHPGIGGSENEEDYIYRNYYQYVHLVLFIQGLLFYIPHLIWKGIDKDHMNKFYDKINACKTGDKKDSLNASPFDLAAIYIEERWGTHNQYVLQYVFCEILAAINVLVQSYLLDVFFHGEFLGLGLLFSAYYNSGRFNDPVRLFPLVTSCHFRRFGSSGRIDIIDAYCILPINVLNVKIYLFLWIWFAVLLLLTLGCLWYFIFSCMFPKYRTLSPRVKKVFFKTSSDHGSYLYLLTNGNFGDWFILSCIKSNMDDLDFHRLVDNLRDRLTTLSSDSKEP